MTSFGGYCEFPFTFGGDDDDALIVAHNAILTGLEPALDPVENSIHEVEAYAEARTASLIWDAGERQANQTIPARMLDALPDYEEMCNIVPEAGETDNARRTAVGAKLRGFGGNSMIDVLAVLKLILGANFEELFTVDPADVMSYWPGGVPGPPGYEWTSNYAIVAIRVNQSGLNHAEFQTKGAKAGSSLNALLPVWEAFQAGIGTEFIVNVGIVGLTFI